MPNRYRVAVIGRTGRGDYGHGLDTVWLRIPVAQLVAVADDDAQGRASAQRRLRVNNAYADYRQMLQKEKPHIVSVAPRWLDCHRDMVLACAEHGAHILLEKPLCRTLDEADQMVRACETHHIKLAIAHQTRYSPVVQRIKDLLARGQIGDILEMRGRGKEDSRVGGVDLMVLGTHIMDLMRDFAGDARRAFGHVRMVQKAQSHPVAKADVRPGPEGMGPVAGNHVTSQYGFDRGTVGHFGSQWCTQPSGGQNRFGLTLYGSRGIIQLTTGSVPPAFFLPDPTWFPGQHPQVAWQRITSGGLGKPETIQDTSLNQGNVWIAQDLIHAIEQDRQPRGSIYDGRAALEMILSVYESHRLGQLVNLPLTNRRHPLSILKNGGEQPR
jgi:predicted dehydrogenase